MDAFAAAAESFEQSQSPSPDSNIDQGQSDPDQAPQSKDHAVFDLSKADKYSFEGREWTRDSLKKLIDQENKFQSMNKDYTTKTQKLAEERKSFESNQNFWKNLPYDLAKLVQDPSLVQEFIKVYPAEFHKIAAEYMKSNQPGSSDQKSSQGPQPDIQMLGRLDRLEKFFETQEVSRHEKEIEATMSELDKKYPDASNFREMVLGRAFEANSKGTELTKESWEDIYKQVDSEVKSLLKAKYGDLVKKQTEANQKAKDVGAGGGAVGKSPVKFKKFDDITKFALDEAAKGAL